MIEKMKFISLTGPKNEIDTVVDNYLSKYEIQLENALTELNTGHNLTPFIEVNPFKDALIKSEELVKRIDPNTVASDKDMLPPEASALIDNTLLMIEDLNEQKKLNKAKQAHITDLMNQIEPFRLLDFDLRKILKFKFIKYRFGRISHEYYQKFSKYVYDNVNTIFYECENDSEYVWGIYFAPQESVTKVDAIYSSLHFDRIMIPDEYEGTPDEAFRIIDEKMKQLKQEKEVITKQIQEKLDSVAPDILRANHILDSRNKNYEVRKLAACTKERQQVFYILCGWITEKDEKSLMNDIKNDPNVYCFSEDVLESVNSKPPTKLKNPAIFRPFEMFIRMYGLPAYNEIDPTIFVALTYSFMFGMMFGDAGQGFCLMVGGFVLYKLKKLDLAAILSCAGFFSTIFGFMYGSIFGYENLMEPIWTNPMHDTMTVLMVAVGFGVCLIFVAMIINIINGIKAKNVGKILFDTNGVAGLVFYAMAITCVVLVMTGKTVPAGIILAIFFGIPLILIYLREPLTRVLEKKKEILPEKKGMFFLENFFELFEILLSYITNTVSFVRVGAFALSHAGMMQVILMLAKATESNPNFLIIVLGNIFVACLEGLIVGIQVLRLEYYEMFSRFYKGNGREFKPFKVGKLIRRISK